jgi:hypothetical protein
MNDVINADTLTARTTVNFDRNGVAFVAISTRKIGTGALCLITKVEVYLAANSDAPEMFLGYAPDLGVIGKSAREAIYQHLYRDGASPVFLD